MGFVGRFAVSVGVSLAFCAAAISAVTAGPEASAAPSPDLPANTFTFSGALSGSLHVLPKADCDGAGPVGVTLTVPGQLQGSRAGTWVIQVLSLQNGTYNLRPSSVIGVTISDLSGDVQWGLDQHGTLTVAGATGTVTADLTGTAGTSLRVVGAWSCPAG